VNILFETAPALAAALWKQKPFDSYEHLINTAEHIIFHQLSPQERIEVINAHPRIGTNPAVEKLSPLSFQEQSCDKEQQLHEQQQARITQVYKELQELNERYEAKFGFKFVVWVNGRTKEQIIPVLKERLYAPPNGNDPIQQELATGLKHMMDIARDRLQKLQPQPQKQPTNTHSLSML
jgi:2-oxo-4-hydroxy-4-carboxy--5-ureidoimidazoline (OHCU) decarboxylase